MDCNLIFKKISCTHPYLFGLISLSIGYPNPDKVYRILESYKRDHQYLIGCFSDKKLIGVIGIEVTSSKIIIRHISVLKELQLQGIGKQLIQYVLKNLPTRQLHAETDEESVGFYRTLGFVCKMFKGKYGKRYACILNASA